jgi:hypothetical protein
MDQRLRTLKAVSLYFMHNVSTLNQCRTLSCVTVVCKHSASYQIYHNYRWDLIGHTKDQMPFPTTIPRRIVTAIKAMGKAIP